MNVLVKGRRRLGKSTLALFLASREKRGIVIFDPRRCFSRFPSSSNLEEFAALVESREHWVVCYTPTVDVKDEFSSFCAVMDCFDSYTMLIDEASQIQGPMFLHPSLERLVRLADPDKISVIQTMHRPQDSHPLCRSLVSHLYLFRTTLERDLDIIESHCGTQARNLVGNLPPHHVLHWSEDTESFDVWGDPARWYIPIGVKDNGRRQQPEPEPGADTAPATGTTAGAAA